MNDTISAFVRPQDWPAEFGDIDLSIHDLPHHSSSTEWWYVNAHLEDKDGKKYAIFASFFRKIIGYNEATKIAEYGHSLTWAIVDVEHKKYYQNSRVDKRAPEIGLKKLRKKEGVKDERVRKAAIEMLEKGSMPYPDRMFEGDVTVAMDKLDLVFDTNSFKKDANGDYVLKLHDTEHKLTCELHFSPQKQPIRHGQNGLVSGTSSEDMFYYFIPQNTVTGFIEIEEAEIEKGEDKVYVKEEVKGTGWYDHEFGRHREKSKEEESLDLTKDVSWNWFCAQLNNGYELTAYHLIDNHTQKVADTQLIMIDPKGNRLATDDFELESRGELWTSTKTFQAYPTEWMIDAPAFDLHIEVKAPFPEQEFATVISKPAFWEGRIEVEGTFEGKEISGPGFVERSGFDAKETLEDFFKAVSRETIKSIKYILPKNPNQEKLNELVSRKELGHFAENIDAEQYSKALIEPIRAIIDRGGKSWRSYAALACCDIVGGDSQVAKLWLALPELMHVGSLIVDDVEDKSDVRRGGPACHVMYGEPTAINAGSACYFIGQICVYRTKKLEAEKRVKIYNLYFEALRAAHSGQALDIHGLDYMMDDVVQNGGGDLLEKRILAIHRLKSAAPASYLAKIGGILGDGTEEQIEGLANYYEALGISFQIIDDTLNLRGFKDGLKTKGEDITAGKITYPVGKAMAHLDQKDRARLWEIVSMKTDNLTLIKEAVDLLDKVNAIDKCVDEAYEIMDKGWKILDPMIRDSMVKLNLRAFSWYVLDRQY